MECLTTLIILVLIGVIGFIVYRASRLVFFGCMIFMGAVIVTPFIVYYNTDDPAQSNQQQSHTTVEPPVISTPLSESTEVPEDLPPTVLPTPILTLTPDPTPAPQVPDYFIIRSQADARTDLQFDAWAESLEGKWTDVWWGKVLDVSKGAILGSIDAQIEMDRGARTESQDVYLVGLDESVGINLDKGAVIGFRGRVKSISNLFGGCTVRLEDAVIYENSDEVPSNE